MKAIYGKSTFVIVLVIALCLFGIVNDAAASRSIVITYDRSSSMYSLNSTYTNTRQDKFFLSAGEFKKLRDAVIYIVLEGDPTLASTLSHSNGKDFLAGIMIPGGKERILPLWKQGDSVVYVDYSKKTGERKWVEYDSRQEGVQTADQIRNALLKVIPVPKGVPDSADSVKDPGAKMAFKDAFPGDASLQDLAELAAYEVLHQMVVGGDSKAEVFWIKVSDMDMDNTGDTRLQAEAVNILTQLRRIQTQLGDQFQSRTVYEILAGNRIHVCVSILTSENLSQKIADLESRIAEDIAALRTEANQFDSDLLNFERDMSLIKKQLENLHAGIPGGPGAQGTQGANETFQKFKQLVNDYDQEVGRLQSLVNSLKPDDLRPEANEESKRRLAEIERIKDSLASKRKTLEELQAKGHKMVSDAEKKLAQHTPPTLQLVLAGSAIPEKDIKHSLSFRRTDPNSNVIQCEGLSLNPGPDNTCKDFKVNRVWFQLLDASNQELDGQAYSVAPTPQPGKSFALHIPDYEKVPQTAVKAALLTEYQYLAKQGQNGSLSTQWIFNKIDVPGRGALGFFLLIFLILAAAAALILLFVFKKGNGRTQPVEIIVQPESDVFEGENVFEDTETMGQHDQIPGAGVITVARLKSNGDTKMIQDGELYVLSKSDDVLGADVWNLNCPDNLIQLKDGMLYLNNKVLNEKQVVFLKDFEGNDVMLEVERLE